MHRILIHYKWSSAKGQAKLVCRYFKVLLIESDPTIRFFCGPFQISIEWVGLGNWDCTHSHSLNIQGMIWAHMHTSRCVVKRELWRERQWSSGTSTAKASGGKLSYQLQNNFFQKTLAKKKLLGQQEVNLEIFLQAFFFISRSLSLSKIFLNNSISILTRMGIPILSFLW